MNTAVQLRRGPGDIPQADLVYGQPQTMTTSTHGPVALFTSGQLVAYRLRHRRRTRLFVFRTLTVDDRLAASLPGVRPRVQLLLSVRSEARVRRLRRLLADLAKAGHDPGALPDRFYLRVGVVLAGRLPPQPVLLSLLSSNLPPERPWTS